MSSQKKAPTLGGSGLFKLTSILKPSFTNGRFGFGARPPLFRQTQMQTISGESAKRVPVRRSPQAKTLPAAPGKKMPFVGGNYLAARLEAFSGLIF